MSNRKGTLYVIATPIGNLEDMSPRAVRVLGDVSVIACEDTRHSGKLLSAFGIKTPTLSFHEHNEEQRTPQLVARLEEGEDIALISDAGTPLLSDPGYRLVKACRDAGIPTYPVPGAFAGAAAASVSGLPTDRLLFAGFLPRKASAQERVLEQLASVEASLVFYLSPHRLGETLETAARTLGDRQAFLVREMTKLYETAYRGTLSELAKMAADQPAQGEYTLVIAAGNETAGGEQGLDIQAYVAGLVALRGLSQKDAIKQAAKELGLSKRDVYQLVTQG